MTLFLILTSITNIALGYGLAVYLRQGKQPWQGKRLTKKRVVSPPKEEKTEEVEQASPAAATQASAVPTAEPEISTDEAQPQPTAEVDPIDAEPVASDSAEQDPLVEDAEEMLQGIESFRAQLNGGVQEDRSQEDSAQGDTEPSATEDEEAAVEATN